MAIIIQVLEPQIHYSKSRLNIRIDRRSFEKAYDVYWEKLFSICYNNIKDVEPAKGMVQDIFRSLWERRADVQIDNLEHYLVRSAKFKVFEYIRNKVNRQKHNAFHATECLSSSNCTEEQVIVNELKAQVNHLVDTLPCQCKRVYKMSREQGLTNREIASALLISERAVEYHITKAMGRLKLALANY